jgi:hypothetical protein
MVVKGTLCDNLSHRRFDAYAEGDAAVGRVRDVQIAFWTCPSTKAA